MSSRKDQDLKEFLITIRKKIKPGLTSAPVWVMQKAGRRIWNKKQKRHWKEADIGKLYKKKTAKVTAGWRQKKLKKKGGKNRRK